MVSENGMRTRERICYLIGKYQCRLEDLRHLLETAMQEGLQS